MNNQSTSPLGVCVLPEAAPNAARTVSYPQYIHEILQHAGLCYAEIEPDALSGALPHLRLLLTVGETTLSQAVQDQLRQWVAEGGQWLSVGGVCGLADLFGVEPEAPAYSSWGGGSSTLGEGYLEIQRAHVLFNHLAIPLHFFNGLPVQPTDGNVLAAVLDAHQRQTERAAVIEKQVGAGRCLLVAADVPGTVVRIQQGIGVTRDGVSAPDGTAPVGDNVLKSGDGGVLDWIFDRQPLADAPGLNVFLQPIADQWRELLLRAIFHLATHAQVRLPVLWLYPRNRPGLAHLSHDTDQNDPAKARQLLDVVAKAGIPSTWCVILPGYPPELIDSIRAAGHELAMHYDAMSDDCPWNAERFHEQWQKLVSLFGDVEPVTNKNHYLRWEGDVELFHWCVEHGIQLDQSKGASKSGEAGFNFGTCHLHRPLDFAGTIIDVLELPTPTQDLEVFAPKALLAPLLDAVVNSHGILHLLFHPNHIDKPGVADAILDAVRQAQARGLAWWTAARINRWERARRQVRWRQYQADDEGWQVIFHHDAALEEATVLWLGSDKTTASIDGEVSQAESVSRWGFDFQAVTFNAEANGKTHLKIR